MKTRLLLASVLLSAGFSVFAQTPAVTDTIAADSAVVTSPAPQVSSTPAAAQVQTTQAAPETSKPKKEKPDMSSTLDGGFSARIGYMLPVKDYMMGNADNGFMVQTVSRYYLTPVIVNAFRLGLDITWVDFGYASFDAANDKKGYTFTASAFGVGPVFSWAIIQDMVLSTYGKALPAFAGGFGEENLYDPIDGTTLLGTETVGRGGFTVAGVWGADFRYGLLDLGFEMMWGKPNMKETGSKTVLVEIQDVKYKINNTRFYIGLSF